METDGNSTSITSKVVNLRECALFKIIRVC